MVDDTIFGKIVKKEIPASIVYEDDKHLAFLDIMPFEKGHTIVIPKKSYKDIFDIGEDEFCELSRVVYRIARHFEKVLGCGVNVWVNNKRVAGQEIEHLHFHVIPRRQAKKTYCLENRESYLKGEMEEFCEKLKLISW